MLRDCYRALAAAMQKGEAVTPAAEWLCDNFPVVEEQVREIQEGLPAANRRLVPLLARGAGQGCARVSSLAWAYVAHTDSVLNKTLFTAFLNAYQDIDELTLGELWALPTTLRVVLLERGLAGHGTSVIIAA